MKKFASLIALALAFAILAGSPHALAQKGKDPAPAKGADAPKDKAKEKAAVTHFEMYKAGDGDFRFRMRGADGAIMCMSSKGFTKKEDCKKAIADIQAQAAKAPVEETDK